MYKIKSKQINSKLIQNKMTKNTKTNITFSSFSHFNCKCGMYKEFNDNKSMMSARNRHMKYCEVAKNSEWLENNGRRENFNENIGKTEIIETEDWKNRMVFRKL